MLIAKILMVAFTTITMVQAQNSDPFKTSPFINPIKAAMRKTGLSFEAARKFKSAPLNFNAKKLYTDSSHPLDEKNIYQIDLKNYELMDKEVTFEQFYSVMQDYFESKHYYPWLAIKSFVDKSNNVASCSSGWKNLAPYDSYIICSTHPATNIHPSHVKVFLERLNEQQDKYLYRLPTYAEWEFAARSGTATPYYWGSNFFDGLKTEWVLGNSKVIGLLYTFHDVGMKPANPYGFHDMMGNATEYVFGFGNEADEDLAKLESDTLVVRGNSSRTESFHQNKFGETHETHTQGEQYVEDLNGLRLVRIPKK
jgi:formylglycine-generating enzyme required for sulfatase activity